MTRLAQVMIKTMTPAEQRAVIAYELHVGSIRHRYSGQRRFELWRGELNRLERAAVGSPSLDRFIEYARKRLAKFAAELDEAVQ